MTGMLFCLCLTTFAQSITLNLNNVTVRSAFDALKKEYKYLFVYGSNDVNTQKIISVSAQDQPLDAVLKQILKGQDVTYEVNEKNIVIRKSAPVRTQAGSQQAGKRIIGIVVDENGEPVIGANIKEKGTATNGTVTDADGNFSLTVAENSVLQVSYIGYVAQEVNVLSAGSGGKPIVIRLLEDVQALDEVVVTALGMTREKKSLGYAIGEVKGDEVDKAKETNLVNALAGKIPGLVISQTAGGPSGSTRVLIRGNTELTGNNEPLYVVDGIPLDNTNFGSADTYGGYDLGDGISSINPDDIETISILKGPAASALYGSRASHGVVLITTKKAGGRKKLGIELNSTTTFEHQLTKYDVQSTYGQGGDGIISDYNAVYSPTSSWGPKIDEGLNITYFDGVKRPYRFLEDNINGFFRTGLTTTNTIVLNSVQDNTGVRLSYTNLMNKDIVPNTGLNRNSVNLRANSKFAKKLDVDIKMNYVREEVKNRPALSGSGYNVGKNLMTLATTFDQAWLKEHYINEKGEYYDWNNYDVYNLNPYWVIHAMENTSFKDRFSGSGVLSYKFNDKFNVRVTGGGEINIFEFQNYIPYSTPGQVTGYLQRSSFNNYTYNAELLFSYKDKIGLLDIGANVGGNVFFVNNHTNKVTARDMDLREEVTLQSFRTKEISENARRKQINSAFGMVNLGFKDYLFLDFTVRCDKSSTLPSNSNTYVYPSISGSFLFSEVLKISKNILSYGKLRASFAQVGSDTNPFQLGMNYYAPDKPYLTYPYTTVDNRLYDTDDRARVPNKNLKPTRTNSAEFGVDLKFLNNRLGVDITYYKQNSKDQILYLPIANSSSFNEKLVNAGNIENKGLEVALNTTPVETKDLSWRLNFNFAHNKNKVIALTEDLNRFTLAKAEYLNVTIDAVAGENYGSIMSPNAFDRNENGDIIVDASGLPRVSSNTEYKVIGNAMWDWTGGISSSLKYKNISLSAIFDIKIGADLYSQTARSLYATGKSKATLEGRDAWYISEEKRFEAGVLETAWTPTGGYLVKGVVETIDGNGNKTYTPNERYVDPQDYWSHVTKYVPEYFISDNSYVKVREITLSYKFPNKWIGKYAEDVFVSFVSRNPFIIFKNIDSIDPDSNYNNSSGMGLEYGSLPSRRSFGININLKF
ncbi:MAG: SusC/RagA family TonB-linked outer membrane protein [Tannerella sp.]|nr:SusC/RagA family TonB-linked outer membrane protein [Tannerella sp.]